jgi:hypothetical protein
MSASMISTPLSTDLFVRLVDFLREKGSDRDPVNAVHDAVEYWMLNAAWNAGNLMPEVLDKKNFFGYMWKSLLLPHGTKIRMNYKGITSHAEISGDNFIYNCKKTTPSEFANTVAGGTARNAWRDLWIKRPHDRDFRLARDLRPASGKSTINLDDLDL